MHHEKSSDHPALPLLRDLLLELDDEALMTIYASKELAHNENDPILYVVICAPAGEPTKILQDEVTTSGDVQPMKDEVWTFACTDPSGIPHGIRA